jgi:hypothetical protein
MFSSFADRYPGLVACLERHFHQDWFEQYESIDEALTWASAVWRENDRRRMIEEIPRLLDDYAEDQELLADLNRYAAAIDPRDDGYSVRGWLLHVRKIAIEAGPSAR